MASLISPSAAFSVQHKVNHLSARPLSANSLSHFHQIVVGSDGCHGLSFKINANLSVEANAAEKESTGVREKIDYRVVSVHRVGVLCENLERYTKELRKLEKSE